MGNQIASQVPLRHPDVLGTGTTVVFLAVMDQYDRLGSVTYAGLIEATGRARSVVQWHLDRLRLAGLVTWEPNMTGTLRPTVAVKEILDVP